MYQSSFEPLFLLRLPVTAYAQLSTMGTSFLWMALKRVARACCQGSVASRVSSVLMQVWAALLPSRKDSERQKGSDASAHHWSVASSFRKFCLMGPLQKESLPSRFSQRMYTKYIIITV